MLPANNPVPAPVVSLTSTARSLWIIFFIFFSLQQTVAQDTANVNNGNPAIPVLSTSFPEYPYNKKRVKWVAGANIAGYGAVMAGLYAAWYSNYPQGKFHFTNDLKQWKQIDKVGHVFSAYAGGKASMEMWRWTGIDRKKRIWIGGLSGAAYLTVIETLDGFSSQWGWSWGDFGANMLGSGMFIAQELAWDQQRIQLKFSAHVKSYKDPVLAARTRELFGSGTAERILKDYNGQTYWLSVGLKTLIPESRLPAWLQVSVGTGAEGMFGARENIAISDETGLVEFDRRDIQRYRQWYLAPDIDLTKIKTNKKGVRVLLSMLNVFKFPTPALEYGKGRFRWRWMMY
ncbi:MAG TPA: DUF2279 domain-containing protein [Chitinophagaceae bacterium]|nr:DUF2279 domain-containing protein [Chitinophagaceae bacterium]